MKTCSEGTSEMVGPAGSTSEGAFSCCAGPVEDELDEPCCLDELLSDDWACAGAGQEPANRTKTAETENRNDRNGIEENPACKSS